MQTRKSFFKTPLLVASLGLVMAFAVACGDDDDTENPAPNGGSKATGGSGSGGSNSAGKTNGGSSNSSAGQKSDAGEGTTPTPTGGTDGGGGEPTKGDAGNGPGPGAGGGGPEQDCSDDAKVGCFCGKPSSLKDFLNACPTTGCEPFDNSALSSLPASGVLPELP